MANEITYTSGLEVTNGNLSRLVIAETTNADQTNALCVHNSQTIGTSHETIYTGDLSTPRWARFKNLDDTNYVEIGLDVSATFYPLVKLLAGETALLPLAASITPYARANTAAVELDCMILDA